jgi:hypothetical protein
VAVSPREGAQKISTFFARTHRLPLHSSDPSRLVVICKPDAILLWAEVSTVARQNGSSWAISSFIRSSCFIKKSSFIKDSPAIILATRFYNCRPVAKIWSDAYIIEFKKEKINSSIIKKPEIKKFRVETRSGYHLMP